MKQLASVGSFYFPSRSCQRSRWSDLEYIIQTVNGLRYVSKVWKRFPLWKTPHPEALNPFLVWMITSRDFEQLAPKGNLNLPGISETLHSVPEFVCFVHFEFFNYVEVQAPLPNSFPRIHSWAIYRLKVDFYYLGSGILFYFSPFPLPKIGLAYSFRIVT